MPTPEPPTAEEHPPPLVTPAAVSRYLGVPAATLANWRYLGRGPRFIRVGRAVRYRPEDLQSWLADQLREQESA